MANNKDFRVKNNIFVTGLGTSTFSGDVSIGDTLTVQGTSTFAGDVNLGGNDFLNIGSITTTGNATIGGNLTVQGTTTWLDTTNTQIKDANIVLNYSTGDSSGNANGAGITIQDAVNSTTDATILWDATYDTFVFSHAIRVPDNQKLLVGSGSDLQIYHDATNSIISNLTGHLTIQNTSDDKDILFRSDDGSGGVAEYFRVDGGSSNVLFSKNLKLSDSASLQIGDNNDFTAGHNGTNTFVANNTGILYITQNTDDANFLLRADNGSGGVANYVVLKGSTGEVLLNHYGNNRFKTTADGVNVMNGGLYFAGTQVITSARNLTNIGTYSGSGSISVAGASSPSLALQDTTNNVIFKSYAQDSNAFTGTTSNHTLNIGTNNTAAITLSTSQNATFAGNIIGSGNLQIDTDTFVVDASNNGVGIGTDSPTASTFVVANPSKFEDTVTFESSAVFNETGASTVDFRVESDTNTHALFVDASTNRVGIFNNAPSQALDVTGQVLATSLKTTGQLEVIQTTTNPASGGIRFLVGGVADNDGNNFKLEAPSEALDMGLQSSSGVEINVGATDTDGSGNLSLAKFNACCFVNLGFATMSVGCKVPLRSGCSTPL